MQALIREIRQELRANMNGVASTAMRQAGMTADYRVNFGVELPRVQALADDVLSHHPSVDRPSLAQSLWKEPVRELRILATLLYPPQQMDGELADIWAADIRTVELAQIAALNLFSKLPAASERAFAWVAADDDMLQICGYYTLIHLLRRAPLNDRSLQELSDQAAAAMASENHQLRLAAQRTMGFLSSWNS